MILTMYTEDKHERVNTQETKRLLFKMVDIQHSSNNDKKKITQGTANGGNNIVARILAWLYAGDVDKLARTQDTYSFWLL